jgi:tetratricopeptide (TPR) repeat protein
MAVPDSSADRLVLGDALERRGLLAEAGEVYGKAIEAATPTGEPLARWILARLLLRTLRFEPAIAQAEAGLARDPDNPELRLARAEGLAGRGHPAADAYDGALRAAEAQAVKGEREPFAAALGAPRLRSLVAERLGGSLRTQPLRYRRALARYLTEQKMWGPALMQWERVLAEAPDDALGHFSRGLGFDAHGRADQALDEYRKAAALDGRNVAYRQRLAQRLWDAEQFYQAIDEWRTLTGLQPRNIQTRLALARALVRVGGRDEAAREYQQVLAMVPGNQEARQALGRLLQSL